MIKQLLQQKDIFLSDYKIDLLNQMFCILKKNVKNKNITIFSIGDGEKPEAGAFFALKGYKSFSIDPVINDFCDIKNLTIYKSKIEDLLFYGDLAVVIMLHSHCSLKEVISSIKYKKLLIIKKDCNCFGGGRIHTILDFFV